MKKPFFTFALLMIFLTAGCSSPDPKAALAKLNHDGLGSYTSTFDVQFYGPTHWAYQLTTRKTAKLREMSLHIIGITGANNPGDVRLVTDGTTSWMIGPGTDNECVQFPNKQGMDPTMIYPEGLVTVKDLPQILSLSGEEKVAGRTGLHYTGKAATMNGWNDAQIDVWQDKANQSLLQFNMQATGDDQIFNTGKGKLTARYETTALDGAPIEPVKGCEIAVPLPPTAKKVVRLPGMASFESSAKPEEIRAFYEAQLPAANWTVKDAPAQAEGATILSYQRAKETVEVHIETGDPSGSMVKLIFITAQ